MQWAPRAGSVGALRVGAAGLASEAVHPMLMFLLETPATLALPAPFLDPDSLPTHEASPFPPSSLVSISLFLVVKSLFLGLSLFFPLYLVCFLNSTYE